MTPLTHPPLHRQRVQPPTHTDTATGDTQNGSTYARMDTRMEERLPPHLPSPVSAPRPHQPTKRPKRHVPPTDTKPITNWFKPNATPTEPEDTDMEPRPTDSHQNTPNPEITPTGESNWKRVHTRPTKDLAHCIAASWNVNGIRTKNVEVQGTSQLTMVVSNPPRHSVFAGDALRNRGGAQGLRRGHDGLSQLHPKGTHQIR